MSNAVNLFATANNETIITEDGERIYPCRCGQIHRGQYAAEDWRHHNCFHEEELVLFASGKTTSVQAICVTCGASLRGVLSDG